MKLLNFYKNHQVVYKITVSGNCMSPILNNGDVVKICPCSNYCVGDIVLCVDANRTKYIHRIHKIVGELYITKADNNLCADAQLLNNNDIFGKVIV